MQGATMMIKIIQLYSNFLEVKVYCMLCEENKKMSKKREKNLNINLPGM